MDQFSFEIINNSNTSVATEELTADAVAFWKSIGVICDEKGNILDHEHYFRNGKYGKSRLYGTRWSTIIGEAIANVRSDWAVHWNSVVQTMLDGHIQGDIYCYLQEYHFRSEEVKLESFNIIKERYDRALEFLTPYIELIKHWQRKGYEPVKVQHYITVIKPNSRVNVKYAPPTLPFYDEFGSAELNVSYVRNGYDY